MLSQGFLHQKQSHFSFPLSVSAFQIIKGVPLRLVHVKGHIEKVRAHLLLAASYTAVGASMLYSEPVSNKKHKHVFTKHEHCPHTQDDLHKNNMLYMCIKTKYKTSMKGFIDMNCFILTYCCLISGANLRFV